VLSQVVVNGVTLTQDDWEALRQRFNLPEASGRFWYDNLSGATGRDGRGTGGFLVPGLNLGGPLQPDASGGTTGVFVNGRELTGGEVSFLQSILRSTIPQGRYWLDGAGNAGPEGGPATVNLVDAYNSYTSILHDPTLRGRSPLTEWDILGDTWS
jgi:hypothetical protein